MIQFGRYGIDHRRPDIDVVEIKLFGIAGCISDTESEVARARIGIINAFSLQGINPHVLIVGLHSPTSLIVTVDLHPHLESRGNGCGSALTHQLIP